jgi:hypothetical protein
MVARFMLRGVSLMSKYLSGVIIYDRDRTEMLLVALREFYALIL